MQVNSVKLTWKGKEKLLSGILTLPGAFLIILFWIAPLIVLVIFSFFTNIIGGGFVSEFTFENYRKIFTDRFYIIILYRTGIISVVVTFLSIIISYPIAYKLARIDPHKANFLLILIIVPFLTATIFRTFGLVYLLGNRGIINSFLIFIGLKTVRLIWNKLGVIIGFLNTLLPYMILALYSSITQVDRSLEEAAYTLGANKLKTTFRITLPLIKAGIATGSIFVFACAMGTYEVPAILGGMEEMVTSMLIHQNVTQINFPGASALSLILLIFVIGAVIVFVKTLGGKIKL